MSDLALFDLDGTLIPKDSDHAFGQFLIEIGWADAAEHQAANDRFYADYVAGTLDIAAYTEFATRPWRGRAPHDIEHTRRRFVDEVVRPMIEPQALALVRRHLEAGDTVAVVTATNDFVTRPIAQLFGVPTLIATDLERDEHGAVTGRIAGTPSFRDGKVSRVADWLAARGQHLGSFRRSHFYSDSTNDLPLLEAVSHPVATNPGAALEAVAQARGWPVLRLFSP